MKSRLVCKQANVQIDINPEEVRNLWIELDQLRNDRPLTNELQHLYTILDAKINDISGIIIT